jgi:glutamine synthetase
MATKTNDTRLAEIAQLIRSHSIHTVEVGVTDTYGHLRGKRIPAERFIKAVAIGGANIADAIYVFNVQCEIVDSPVINMGTGYLDMHLVPDLSTFRLLTHRPGYAVVIADAVNEHTNEPHPLDPRAILHAQADRVKVHGFDAVVATELECYLFREDWTPFQTHVQYSSLTDALELEAIVADMRSALLGAGIPLESSNPEYGPGQLEINFSAADPVTTADNTVLFTSIVKQVAAQHHMHASFMPKPYAAESGSGMHIHTSLSFKGKNLFGAASDGLPNELMGWWTAGLVHNAEAIQLIGIPSPNGYRRVQPFTFCPTHAHWGEDNRTVMARLTMHSGSANRVEFRSAGADANPYLAIAAVLAAGCDGLENKRELPPMAAGDTYTEPGNAVRLPTTMLNAMHAYRGSSLANALGQTFSENFLVLCENELAVSREFISSDSDEVTAWEFNRYREHS